MAPNVTVHFWAANDINGTPLLEITDEDTFFKGFRITPDLYALGGWELRLARAWGFQLFDSGAVDAEVFVRFLLHAYSDSTYFYGGVLDKRSLTVVHRDEIGAEELIIGGAGPKEYLNRSALGIEQRTGLGFNLDLDNGVWRWNSSASAGRVLDTVVDEDAARSNPSLPDLTVNFDDTNDSDGNPWTNDITAGDGEYETPVGSSLLDVIFDLEDLVDALYTTIHLGTVATPKYELNAFQSFGDDVTGTSFGPGVCRIAEGANISTTASEALVAEGVAIRKATHVIVEGKDGVWVTEVRPSWSPGDYVKWDKIEHPRSSSETILHKAGERWLRRQNNGDQQISVEILPGADTSNGLYFPAPNDVLWLGNTITLDTTADGSVHSPLDYNNADQTVTGFDISLGDAGDSSTALKTARSFRVIVNLNGERAGFSQSPNQTSASSGNTPCQCPPLCHAATEGTPFVADQFLRGEDGGDDPHWTGLLSNQGGSPGNGANGTSFYMYKSHSPNVYQQSLACSAGDSITAFGYYGCRSQGHLILAFGTAAGGTAGNLFLPTVIGSANDLHPDGPGHSHWPDEWTFFSQTFIAPSGTNSYALGHGGTNNLVDFDEVQTGVSAVLGDNPYAGTEHGAARCDHVHPASEIVVTPVDSISSENVQDALEEIAADYQAAINDAVSNLEGQSFSDRVAGIPWVVDAHRGDIGSVDSYPEETIEAIQQAFRKGAHVVKIDVCASSDGTNWLSHDLTVDRCTDGTGTVLSKTDAALAALNVDGGFGYNAARHGTSLNLATLEDAFNAARQANRFLKIQIKDEDATRAAEVAQFIVDQNMVPFVLLQSEFPTDVKEVSSAITVLRDYDQDLTNVDWLNTEYVNVTGTSFVTSRVPYPITSYISIDDYGADENEWQRDMFDFGIGMLETNNLDAMLALRNQLLFHAEGQQNRTGRWENATNADATAPEIMFLTTGDVALVWTVD